MMPDEIKINVVIEFPVVPGFDILRAAITHLSHQFHVDMTREEAQANIDARILLINLNTKLLDEAEHECARD